MVRRTIGRHDLSIGGRPVQAVADALPILDRLTDPVRRSEYAHLVADLAGVTESSVRQALESRRRGLPAEVAGRVAQAHVARDKVEREMLKLLVRDHALSYAFAAAAHRRALPCAVGAQGRSPRSRRRRRRAPCVAGGDDEKLGAMSHSLAVEPLDGDAAAADYAESVWSRLQEFVLKASSDALRLQLQKLNPTTDPGYDELFAAAGRRSTASCDVCARSPRSTV